MVAHTLSVSPEGRLERTASVKSETVTENIMREATALCTTVGGKITETPMLLEK